MQIRFPLPRVRLLAAVACVLLAKSSPTASQVTPLLMPTSEWTILFDSAYSPLSGGVILGAMVGQQASPTDLRRISLRLPGGVDSVLCVTVRARNARLRATAQFKIPPQAEYRPIILQGIQNDRVNDAYRRVPVRDVTILVEAGTNCSDSPRQVVPANWGERALHGDVYIYANTYGSSTVRWMSPHRAGRIERCETFRDGGSVAYNAVCTLPALHLGANITAALVQNATAGGDSRVSFRIAYLP